MLLRAPINGSFNPLKIRWRHSIECFIVNSQCGYGAHNVRLPTGTRILTRRQHEANEFITSAAAGGYEVLALSLRLGKQQHRSEILIATCDAALGLLAAGVNEEEPTDWWDAVFDVNRELNDAVRAANAVEHIAFLRMVCDAEEFAQKLDEHRVPAQALYTHREDLFWRFMIDEINTIRKASARI